MVGLMPKMWKYAKEPSLLILQWIGYLSIEKQAQNWLYVIILCCTLQHNPALNRKGMQSLNRSISNDNLKHEKQWLSSPPYIICEPSHIGSHPDFPLSSCKLSSTKTALSPHECHSSMTTLLTWSKLMSSTCIPSSSHPKVLNPASYSSSFHIRSVIFPAKEIYGHRYPLIHLPSVKKKL